MKIERFTRNGLARYRIHSDYDRDSIAVEPKELLTLLTWLQEHEHEVVNDSLANMLREAEREMEQEAPPARTPWDAIPPPPNPWDAIE